MEFTEKSVIVTKFGGYDCIKIDKHPLLPLSTNVEIEVKYCGLNFADLYTRLGLMPKQLPFVLGMECTGIVTKIGDSITTDLKIGDHVICYDYNGGMYSNVVRTTPNKCFLLPNEIPLKEGAALFVNYLTAYFTLFHLGNLKPKETVLIKSCAGGVGWAATQLARSLDTASSKVTLIGVTSKDKTNLMKENGIDHIVNYENYLEEIKQIAPSGVDLILETEATNHEQDSKLLKQLGRIVLLGSNKMLTNPNKLSIFTLLQTWWQSKNIRPLDLILNNHSISGIHLGLLALNDRNVIMEALTKIYEMFQNGTIQPRIDSIWKISDIIDATKVLSERRNIGKVLLEID